ncbi:hypothetical protein FB451DRAFT_1024754, partial [Mycena latifolia]
PGLQGITPHGLALRSFKFQPNFQAAEDDVLPLSAPIETATGELVDTIFVSKGTAVTMPLQCHSTMNRSVTFWGPDAKVFNPTRWLDGTVDQHRAQELQGYRHILALADWPCMCLDNGLFRLQISTS